MCERVEPTLQDRLEVTLMKGDKVLYDSKTEKEKMGTDIRPKLVPDPKPMKFCLEDGEDVIPLIYLCPCCGRRYQKMYDPKTKQSMVLVMPEEPPVDEEKIAMQTRIKMLETQLGVPATQPTDGNTTPST